MGLLEQLGYRNVSHFGGGIVRWRKANYPFDTGRERSLRPEQNPLMPREAEARLE